MYVGETGLCLETRKNHHQRDKKSALHAHRHDFESLNWEFLLRSHNTNVRKIAERFLISDISPELNRNSGIKNYVFAK